MDYCCQLSPGTPQSWQQAEQTCLNTHLSHFAYIKSEVSHHRQRSE